MGQNAFGGNGSPAVFMTDDSAAEKAALRHVFPTSTQLLCQFHIAQAVWRWLWNSNNGIELADRKHLMTAFRKVMYASNLDDLNAAYADAVMSDISVKYPQWIHHLERYWSRKDEWLVYSRRNNEHVRGNHTNNYCEAAVRIFKDVVLSRCKAYNSVALVDFVCNQFERHYVSRLLQFSNYRDTRSSHILNKLVKKSKYIHSAEQIKQEGDVYFVPSESDEGLLYEVDIQLGICGCEKGICGKFCKHQAAVVYFFGGNSVNQPATTPDDRFNAAYLALHDKAPPKSFFQSLHDNGNSVGVNTEACASNDSARGTKPISCDECETTEAESVNLAEMDEMRNDRKIEHTLNLINEVCRTWKEFVTKNGESDDQVVSGLEKLLKKSAHVTTTAGFASFLHSIGTSTTARQRAGAAIRVQPTALSRRRAGLTRSATRLPAGRLRKRQNVIKNTLKSKSANVNKAQSCASPKMA